MKTNKGIRMYVGLIILAGCMFSFSGNKTYGATGANTWVDDLHAIKVNANEKKEIVETFCNVLTGNVDPASMNAEKQSLFLSLLCSNGAKKEGFFGDDDNFANKYIKKDFTFKKAKFQGNCRKEYKEECNVSELADNLLTLVLSEMFTIREATVFGVRGDVKDFSSSEKLKERKNRYIKKYLGIDVEQIDYCAKGSRHKGVCKLIENQIKGFKKAYKNMQIIDLTKLYDEDKAYRESKIRCSDKDDKADKAIDAKNNMIYCGLVGEEDGGLTMFVDVIYNEIQWYALFTSYYGQILSQRDKITESIRSEYLQSFAGRKKFIPLTEETVSDLNDIAVTFPIHVVISAFEEDLLYVRDKYLVKLVTPFYCLYYKLRNVQFNK